MAQELYRFFDSAEGDARSYDAGDLASAMRTLAQDGVAGLDDTLRVSAQGSGLTTLVAPGRALVNGYFYELRDDGGATMAFTHAASAGNDRVDRILVRLDTGARTIALMKREGEAAASPQAPALVRAGGVYELSLARVRVRAGATALTAADVTDERADESVCGAALPEGVKLSALWARMPKALASASADGLMSAADKAALDALANGAGDEGGVAARVTALEDDSADTQVHLYTHACSESGAHAFTTADGASRRNGRVKITALARAGDTFTLNGGAVTVTGTDGWVVGRWASFLYEPAVVVGGVQTEAAQVNFRSGSGNANGYEYITVSDADALPANPAPTLGKTLLAFVTGAGFEHVEFGFSDALAPNASATSRTMNILRVTIEAYAYAGCSSVGFMQCGVPVCPVKATLLTPAGSVLGGDVPAYTWRRWLTVEDGQVAEHAEWTPWSGNP